MAKIKLFIANTIDGFIAREDGSLDWLFDHPNPKEIDHGYNDFYSGIDVVVMGRKTYEDVLGFDVDWPYGNCKTFVITSNKEYKVKTPNTITINKIDQETIQELKKTSKKDIWVVGGGKIITSFLNLDSVDEMVLSIVPLILGKGIRLFPDKPKETQFRLTDSHQFGTGIVNLTFVKNQGKL